MSLIIILCVGAVAFLVGLVTAQRKAIRYKDRYIQALRDYTASILRVERVQARLIRHLKNEVDALRRIEELRRGAA